MSTSQGTKCDACANVFLHVGVGRVFVDPWEAKIMANLRAAYDSCAADRGDMTTDQLFKGGPS